VELDGANKESYELSHNLLKVDVMPPCNCDPIATLTHIKQTIPTKYYPLVECSDYANIYWWLANKHSP